MYKFVNKKERNVFYACFFVLTCGIIAFSVDAIHLYSNGSDIGDVVAIVIVIIIGIIGLVYFHIQFSKDDEQNINKSLDEYQ